MPITNSARPSQNTTKLTMAKATAMRADAVPLKDGCARTDQLSRNDRSFRDLLGCFSFLSAFASI
jgi:hypothetical protein